MVHTTRTSGSMGAGYGQPVRFYKTVAITFLVLTIGLLGMIAFMSAKRADITIVTKAEAVDVSFPVEVGTAADGAVAGTVTSTVITFETSFTPRTTTTTAATESSAGMVTLINDSDSDQPLVATTRLLAPNSVLYRLSKSVTVPAKGSIQAEVYADKKEAASNLEQTQFTIPGLVTDRQKEVYAKSNGPLTAVGERKVGIVTAEDLTAATAAFNTALKDKATALAKEKFPGTEAFGFIVQSTGEPQAKIGDLVESFRVSGRATVALANYKSADLANAATAMLNRKIVDNNDVLESASAEPSVIFESYDSAKNALTLRVTQTGTVNLDQNSPKLQKTVFFGKTEDEVRRYVMSLDHVESVDMKFKPLWNKTVPQVADRVKITIQQVQ